MGNSTTNVHDVKRVTIIGPTVCSCKDIDHHYTTVKVLAEAHDGNTYEFTLFGDEKGPDISLDIKRTI